MSEGRSGPFPALSHLLPHMFRSPLLSSLLLHECSLFPASAAFGNFGDLYTGITSQMDCIAARNQAITISSSTHFFFFMITSIFFGFDSQCESYLLKGCSSKTRFIYS